MLHGTAEQKERFLPGIAAGELVFAVGYTEPGAGTDLASLRTSAVLKGENYVVNGNKIFTSGADDSDYIWLAVRTDKDAPKHKGISLLIVDVNQDGFSCTPIQSIGNSRTTASYYDNVVVPVSMRVGEENAGWKIITSQLNYERLGLAAWGVDARGLFDKVMDWANQSNNAGSRPIDLGWVKTKLAEAYCKIEALRMLNGRMISEMDNAELSPATASMLKVYSTECMVDVGRILLDIVGPLALVRRGTGSGALNGELEAILSQGSDTDLWWRCKRGPA